MAAPAKKATAKKIAAAPTKKTADEEEGSNEVAVEEDSRDSRDADPTPRHPRTSSRRRAVVAVVAVAMRDPRSTNKPAYTIFVIDHPVGSIVDGTVDRFSSHGAYVGLDGGAVGYVALKSLGDPPPRSAREVL